MRVLAVETSGAIGSVAACEDDGLVAEETLERGLEHGRLLLLLLDRLLRAAGWRKSDIELIAVDVGPGSYTGLRVGLTCARTVAVMADVPLVGVCSLDALARNAPADASHVLTVLDARRGEVYAAAFLRDGGRIRRVAGPAVMRPEEAAGLFAEDRVAVLGDGLLRHATVFEGPRFERTSEENWRIRASVVAGLGLDAWRSGSGDDPLKLQPLYMRLPEAEEKRRAER